MYIRNSKNQIIKFDYTIFKDEREIYANLWKIMYNIKLIKPCKTNEMLIKYIKKKIIIFLQ